MRCPRRRLNFCTKVTQLLALLALCFRFIFFSFSFLVVAFTKTLVTLSHFNANLARIITPLHLNFFFFFSFVFFTWRNFKSNFPKSAIRKAKKSVAFHFPLRIVRCCRCGFLHSRALLFLLHKFPQSEGKMYFYTCSLESLFRVHCLTAAANITISSSAQKLGFYITFAPIITKNILSSIIPATFSSAAKVKSRFDAINLCFKRVFTLKFRLFPLQYSSRRSKIREGGLLVFYRAFLRAEKTKIL